MKEITTFISGLILAGIILIFANLFTTVEDCNSCKAIEPSFETKADIRFNSFGF